MSRAGHWAAIPPLLGFDLGTGTSLLHNCGLVHVSPAGMEGNGAMVDRLAVAARFTFVMVVAYANECESDLA